MNIGTALTPGATRVMLLGSGELGKEVAISLQRYGVEVIAVDRYEGAPAHQVAHRSHVIDMTDSDALLALIRRDGRNTRGRHIRPQSAARHGGPAVGSQDNTACTACTAV